MDLNFEPQVVEKEFDYRGTKIQVHFYRPTRTMRNKAMLEAVDVYRREHPNSSEGEGIGGDPNTLEKELACRMIKWWNIHKPPRLAWDWLPVDLGDKIVDILEIKELFAFDVEKNATGTLVTKLTSEAEAAKN